MEFKVCSSIKDTLGNIAHLAVERTNKMVQDQQIVLKKEIKMDRLNLAKWQAKYEDKLGKFINEVEVEENGVKTTRKETVAEVEARLKAQYDAFLAD